MMSVFMCLMLFAINPLLQFFGQPQSVLDILDGYYYCVTLSLIPYLIFLSFKQFLEGLGNTFYSMLITLGCNILNIFLNFGFIYGYMGFPELGVTGAGMATLISRVMMPIVFIIIIFVKKEYRTYLSYFSFSLFSLKMMWKLLKVGFPIAAQMTVELFSLTFMTIMMGWLGEKTLAANQIAQTMIGFSFMIANGVSSASTILVSHDLGVVARCADRVAIMYAGKIVEIGTAEEVYYDPRHPYTWGLMQSLPALNRGAKELKTIPGMPPTLIDPPVGDAFACRTSVIYSLVVVYMSECAGLRRLEGLHVQCIRLRHILCSIDESVHDYSHSHSCRFRVCGCDYGIVDVCGTVCADGCGGSHCAGKDHRLRAGGG